MGQYLKMKTSVIAHPNGGVCQRNPHFWGSQNGREDWNGNGGDVSKKEAVKREEKTVQYVK